MCLYERACVLTFSLEHTLADDVVLSCDGVMIACRARTSRGYCFKALAFCLDATESTELHFAQHHHSATRTRPISISYFTRHFQHLFIMNLSSGLHFNKL